MHRRTFIAATAAMMISRRESFSADLPYLTSAVMANVAADPDGYLPALFAQVQPQFMADLPPDFSVLSTPMRKLAFATVLAFLMKPYGNSNPLTLADCLAAPDMNCDNYCVFAYFLYRILQPTGGPEPVMLGWNGGTIGNHAQLQATYDGYHLLLDPTIGFIARDLTLSGLCRGYGPREGRYKSFFANASNRSNLVFFNTKATNAILTASFMASDILYYFPSVPAYLAASGSSSWATPQSWRL